VLTTAVASPVMTRQGFAPARPPQAARRRPRGGLRAGEVPRRSADGDALRCTARGRLTGRPSSVISLVVKRLDRPLRLGLPGTGRVVGVSVRPVPGDPSPAWCRPPPVGVVTARSIVNARSPHSPQRLTRWTKSDGAGVSKRAPQWPHITTIILPLAAVMASRRRLRIISASPNMARLLVVIRRRERPHPTEQGSLGDSRPIRRDRRRGERPWRPLGRRVGGRARLVPGLLLVLTRRLRVHRQSAQRRRIAAWSVPPVVMSKLAHEASDEIPLASSSRASAGRGLIPS
jgi:hypothetical protein